MLTTLQNKVVVNIVAELELMNHRIINVGKGFKD